MRFVTLKIHWCESSPVYNQPPHPTPTTTVFFTPVENEARALEDPWPRDSRDSFFRNRQFYRAKKLQQVIHIMKRNQRNNIINFNIDIQFLIKANQKALLENFFAVPMKNFRNWKVLNFTHKRTFQI